MPTYQYACTACDHRLEAVQSFADDPLTQCPTCEGRLRKLFGSVGIVFKGPGFYRTDSRASANGKDGTGGNGDGSRGAGAGDQGSTGASGAGDGTKSSGEAGGKGQDKTPVGTASASSSSASSSSASSGSSGAGSSGAGSPGSGSSGSG